MEDNIFDMVLDFTKGNHYVDVEDKVPIFVCSIGTHIINAANKCNYCPHEPKEDDETAWCIPECMLRHDNPSFYTPMSHVADTRLHILMRGAKGSGKSALIQMFLSTGTGLLYSPDAEDLGMGFRTDIGPGSITEAGMFGSVNEEGQVTGRPLAREMCGGFLGFEEFSSLVDAAKKDHSTDMTNQMLTSTDNGRVKKVMRSGRVTYLTRYTIWAGTQPGRFEMESGMDRRFFIIDIEMSAEKELLYKQAQAKQASMTAEQRAELIFLGDSIRDFFTQRAMEVIAEPPTSLWFSEEFNEWLLSPNVRGHEADLFRRLGIGYAVMSGDWKGGRPLEIHMTNQLRDILDRALSMRRNVMDADLDLIRTTFWNTVLPRSQLVKEVQRMVTGDYQAAKRWIADNLMDQPWYTEHKPRTNRRGPKGIACYIGVSPEDIE